MKKLWSLLFILIIPIITAMRSYSFSLNGSGSFYTGSAKDFAKYYPQSTTASNKYGGRGKNYIYTAKQARYYGYRVPDQTGKSKNPYYSPYVRGY